MEPDALEPQPAEQIHDPIRAFDYEVCCGDHLSRRLRSAGGDPESVNATISQPPQFGKGGKIAAVVAAEENRLAIGRDGTEHRSLVEIQRGAKLEGHLPRMSDQAGAVGKLGRQRLRLAPAVRGQPEMKRDGEALALHFHVRRRPCRRQVGGRRNSRPPRLGFGGDVYIGLSRSCVLHAVQPVEVGVPGPLKLPEQERDRSAGHHRHAPPSGGQLCQDGYRPRMGFGASGIVHDRRQRAVEIDDDRCPSRVDPGGGQPTLEVGGQADAARSGPMTSTRLALDRTDDGIGAEDGGGMVELTAEVGSPTTAARAWASGVYPVVTT